jgi:NAD+ synthase (glutamine-hydrolysing)
VLVGTVARNRAATGRAVHNAAALLRGGRVEAVYAKRLLPTYDVFDEGRYFEPGHVPLVVTIAGRRVGLSICEDFWAGDRVGGRRLYEDDPPADLVAAGAEVVVNLSASPWHAGKDERRRALFAEEARRMGRPLVVCQLVGGNDDVLFDGRSRAFDAAGRETARLPAFEEGFEVVDTDRARPLPPPLPSDPTAELRRALVMGVASYARKTGFTDAVLGLSGGVDSAVTAAIAAEALGPDHVLGVGMPGPFSAPESLRDAAELARRLGMPFETIPITPVYEGFLETLRGAFGGRPFDTAEENLQARVRGAILMAISNKRGHLVLTTGNKSELSVGYCTLYGDMCGGLAVIADVWKTRVYDLARSYEASGGAIPRHTIERPPSAELRPGQQDSDSLPPYDVLDRILARRIEEGASVGDLVAAGEDEPTVRRVLRMVERAEHKRRQMAPGLKVTPLAFGVGWRMPIARPTDLSAEG